MSSPELKSPLKEATEDSLSELFDRDVEGLLSMTPAEFDRLIAEERRMAEEWAKAEALAGSKRGRPKPQNAQEIKNLEDIGL